MEVIVKKTVFLVILTMAISAIIIGCDQQKALDQILEKPEMKQYLMTQMMSDQSVKDGITAEILADSVWVSQIVTEYGKTMANREQMLNTLLQYPGMGEIMLSKMAEDETLRKAMKDIGNRRR